MGYKVIDKSAIMVTGAGGFIGSHMVDRLLERGNNVVGVDYAGCYGFNGKNLWKAKEYSAFDFVMSYTDICDTKTISDLCEKYSVRTIINCAAETHVDRSIIDVSPFIHSNVDGVASLLKVCAKNATQNILFVHFSSDEVYGPFDEEAHREFWPLGFREDAGFNPQNPYAATKAAADLMIESFRNTFGINYLIVRPTNNYGPRQDIEKFIPSMANKILRSQPIQIYGDGKQMRDWMFVKDTVDCVEQLIWNIKNTVGGADLLNQIFNLSCRNEKENLEVAQKVIQHFERLNPTLEHIADRLGHDRRYCVSDRVIANTINTSDYIKRFDKNLKETLEFYTREFKRKEEKNE